MKEKIEKLIKQIYKEHNKATTEVVHIEYDEDNITCYVHQKDERLTITGLNNDTQRQVDLTAKKYDKLFKDFKKIADIEKKYTDKRIVIYFKDEEQFKNNLIRQEEKIIDIDYVKEVQKLKDELKLEKEKNKILEEKLNELSTLKNTRNAGRKEKFTLERKQQIVKEKLEGETIRGLAKKYNCGIGTVHKIINEHK